MAYCPRSTRRECFSSGPQVSVITSFHCIACVAWRFWLGALSGIGGQGQRNREEIGAGATNIFLAASPSGSRAFLRLCRSVVLPTKPPRWLFSVQTTHCQ